MPERLNALKQWLSGPVGLCNFSLCPASTDASFRRYFRVGCDDKTYIAMDAPPAQEDCHPFVAVARQLRAVGVNVPVIHAEDLAQGFLLLDDLGSTHYLDILAEENVEDLYGHALYALLRIQARGPADTLPPYDLALLLSEMELFRDWLIGQQLEIKLSRAEHRMLDETFALLADNALAQPQVYVHRDYHSRNLLVTPSSCPGILDFQDAVKGPVTYDLVSLLRDCYIAWPRDRVEQWAWQYFELALQAGVLKEAQRECFLRWFDLMGIQRHLKAAGIFARLNQRDSKPGYLADIPRTLGYVVDVGADYPEVDALKELIAVQVLPRLNASR